MPGAVRWACGLLPGSPGFGRRRRLTGCAWGWLAQVVVYVDGVRVGQALALEETPHHIIHRLCELDLAVSDLEQPPQQKGVGFRLKLPSLMEGKHEVRPCPLCFNSCLYIMLWADGTSQVMKCEKCGAARAACPLP